MEPDPRIPSQRFDLKERSLKDFFKEYVIDFVVEERSGRNDVCFFLRRQEFYLKKSSGFKVGQVIRIELEGAEEITSTGIRNTYDFEAYEYDDFALKMVLTNLRIDSKLSIPKVFHE